MGKEIDVQEARRAPNKMNSMKSTPRHIIKRPKVKEKVFKAVREKQLVIYKGNPLMLSADFFS